MKYLITILLIFVLTSCEKNPLDHDCTAGVEQETEEYRNG